MAVEGRSLTDFEARRLLRRPLRVAVVGVGYWGPNIARVLDELEEAEVAVVCDASEDPLAKLGRRYPAFELTTSYERVLDDPRVDAVAIATPVSTHYPLAAAAIDAGKHVFVEKPLAGSLEDAEDLVARAAARGVTLMPGHTFLYSPSVNIVGELISSGELGEIYFISMSRVNLGLHQPDASVVWDLAPHDFSILRYWLRETPDTVAALARSCIVPGMPDVAFVTLAFPSRTIAHVELSWLAPSKLRRTTVVGSRKMVVYDDTASEPVRIFDSGVTLPEPQTFGEYQLTYRAGNIVSPRVPAVEPLRLELLDFCRAAVGETAPRSSTEIGLDVLRMIEAVDRSLERDGALVSANEPPPLAATAER